LAVEGAGFPRPPVNIFPAGNQQKVVFAKWNPRPRVCCSTSRPSVSDVGAREEIYGVIRECGQGGDRGSSSSSSDLVELLRLCDRISASSTQHRQDPDRGGPAAPRTFTT